MRFSVQFFSILVMSHLLGLFLPWYIITIIAFLCGYFLKSGQNVLAGFLAVAILWTFNAWLADTLSSSALQVRMADILGLNVALVYLATAVVGGTVAGLATMAGSLLKE